MHVTGWFVDDSEGECLRTIFPGPQTRENFSPCFNVTSSIDVSFLKKSAQLTGKGDAVDVDGEMVILLLVFQLLPCRVK